MLYAGWPAEPRALSRVCWRMDKIHTEFVFHGHAVCPVNRFVFFWVDRCLGRRIREDSGRCRYLQPREVQGQVNSWRTAHRMFLVYPSFSSFSSSSSFFFYYRVWWRGQRRKILKQPACLLSFRKRRKFVKKLYMQVYMFSPFSSFFVFF